MLETKEGMPSGESPSLVAWIFLEYYLGVPCASKILGSCQFLFSSYRYLTQNLKTSITQNLTELREMRQYNNEQIIHLGTVKTRFIIILTQCLLYLIISTIYIEQYNLQKLETKQTMHQKTESVKNRTVCKDLN